MFRSSRQPEKTVKQLPDVVFPENTTNNPPTPIAVGQNDNDSVNSNDIIIDDADKDKDEDKNEDKEAVDSSYPSTHGLSKDDIKKIAKGVRKEIGKEVANALLRGKNCGGGKKTKRKHKKSKKPAHKKTKKTRR
jgi:hypothetical protein